ncbi:MAG: amidohydrolase family protein [Solirubrobacteraceae bacterium]
MQLIVDGHHLAPETVTVARRAAPGRLALVTDAVAAAAAPDGEYPIGPTRIRAANGIVRDDDGRLAGSALTMIEAVRSLHALGAPLEEALSAASTIPARIADRPDLGRLQLGAPADIVVLDDRLEIQGVLT